MRWRCARSGQLRLFLGTALVCACLVLTAGAGVHDDKRWQALREVVQTEIKVSARKFVQERGQDLAIPLEIDLLMLGFEEDGAYHFKLNIDEVEELLASQFTDRELCPTMWDTGHQASTCQVVSFVTLRPGDPMVALKGIEDAIATAMKRVQPTFTTILGSRTPVYDVNAEEVEHEIHRVLDQVYHQFGMGAHDQGALGDPMDHRLAIVVLNPSKQRMNPGVSRDQGLADWASHDILTDWKQGKISSERVRAVEAGYSYRYSYNGKGASAAWVSSYNFVVLDMSAGPTTFGPVSRLAGQLTPSPLPRVQPVLESLALEVEGQGAAQVTLANQMRQGALEHQSKLLTGQLASALGAAASYVMLPDMAFRHLELGKTVVVALTVLHDHDDFNLLEPSVHGHTLPGVDTFIDVSAVYDVLNSLLPDGTMGVVMPRDGMVHWHPEILTALTRARMTWSDAVMLDPPYAGLHHTQHSRLDSSTLMTEIRHLLPHFAPDDGDWYTENMEFEERPEGHLASSVRHNATRMLHVLVLSLKAAPPGVLFENGQLVAASRDLVVVLQLVGAVPSAPPSANQPVEPGSNSPPSPPAGSHPTHWEGDEAIYDRDDLDADMFDAEMQETKSRLKLYSGHIQDGLPLELDGASGVMARITGGMAMALSGVTYPWEKAELNGVHVQDWRWSVGCVPWGPHAACSSLSRVFRAAARRNFLFSHIESALAAVQYRLEAVDEVVSEVYNGPWMSLMEQARLEAADNASAATMQHRTWIDTLASQVKEDPDRAFNPSIMTRIQAGLSRVENTLDTLAWSVFTQDAATTDTSAHLNALLQLVDELTSEVDEDIHRCQEVAACCRVRPGAPLALDIIVLLLLGLLLAAFGIIAYMTLAAKKVYRPGIATERRVSGSGSGPSGLFGRTSERHSGGMLPLFSHKSNSGSLLPM